MRFFFVRGK